jgi:hypothetical protein
MRRHLAKVTWGRNSMAKGGLSVATSGHVMQRMEIGCTNTYNRSRSL